MAIEQNYNMPHKLLQWPSTVYPNEAVEIVDAREAIDVALRNLSRYGPSPDGYNSKPLGKKMNYLWQLNLRAAGRQVRILYCPYGDAITIFRIHKKSSPQEQKAAYKLAIERKKEFDRLYRD